MNFEVGFVGGAVWLVVLCHAKFMEPVLFTVFKGYMKKFLVIHFYCRYSYGIFASDFVPSLQSCVPVDIDGVCRV